VTLRRVASYDRIVGASIERAWENVRDWEHLPWLHRSSFRSIELIEQSRDGWRARVGLPSDHEIVLELAIEGDRYVSRTLEGRGEGSEIWTQLSTHSTATTSVRVHFELPALERANSEKIADIGSRYRTLYTRLWDEDEAMMIERAAALERRSQPPPHRLDLGPREALQLPLDVSAGSQRLRLVEIDGKLIAHSRTCPHWLGPLEATDDPTRLECPWHGYVFDAITGRSCDGRKLRLVEAPRILTERETGHVVLDWQRRDPAYSS
jgi:nitrite reductase/ring-hydroxylating ferredoxin subunit